jgi:hypothetical protein
VSIEERESKEKKKRAKKQMHRSPFSLSLTVKLSFETMPAVAFSLVSSEPDDGRGWGCG